MNEDTSMKDFFKELIKLGKGLFFIVFYFAFQDIVLLLFDLVNIDYTKWPNACIYTFSITLNLIVVATIMFAYRKIIKKSFDEFKKKYNDYLKKYIKYWLFGLIGMIFSNLILVLISGNIASNEETVRSLFSNSPIYIYIAAVFVAPILEELVFRFCLREVFPHSNWLFIILSGLIFGGCHVYGNIETWFDILYIIPYSSLGIAFAYVYTKTDNIFSTMGLHFIHNGLLMSLQIIMLLCM